MMSDIREQVLAFANTMWRHRWWGVVVGWLICIAGWAFVTTLPDRFEAQARVYVDTDTLLEPLLNGLTVRPNVDQQILIMQRTLLSRPNIEQVLRATDLELRATTPAERERLVDRVTANTRMTPQGTRNLFVLSHIDSDPQLATRIVQSVLNIFMESQLGAKRRDFAEAQSFIDRQIRDYERSLQAAERRLAQFRHDNLEVLPAAGNFAAQASAAAQRRDQLRSDLADARVRRDNLREQLAGTPAVVQLSPAAVAGAGGRYSGRIGEIQQQIDQLRLRYTDEHPDIVTLRRQIQLLRTQGTTERRAIDATTPREAAPAAARAGATVPNTVHEQIRLRIADEETSIATLQRRLGDAEAEVERLRGLAGRVPQIEAELANLDRDYTVIKHNYEQMLARRESARIAQAADERTDALQFRIIDPPRVPLVPAAPNRTILFALVLIGGLGAGIVATAILAQMNESFWTPAQLREAFQFPILGCVTYLATRRQRRARAAGDLAFASLCLSLIAIGGVLALFGAQVPGLVNRIVTTIADRWALQV